jgi:hypothetical protein
MDGGGVPDDVHQQRARLLPVAPAAPRGEDPHSVLEGVRVLPRRSVLQQFPAANIGGDIFRIADAARYGPSKTAALSAVAMDRIVGLLAMATLALVTTLPALDQFHLTLHLRGAGRLLRLCASLLWAVFHPGSCRRLEGLLQKIGLASLSPPRTSWPCISPATGASASCSRRCCLSRS